MAAEAFEDDGAAKFAVALLVAIWQPFLTKPLRID